MAKPDAPTSTTSTPSPPPRVFFAVTGFGPFACVSQNPTDLVVRRMREEIGGGGGGGDAAAAEVGKEKEKKQQKHHHQKLARAIVKAEVLRVSADDAARWIREELERVAERVQRQLLRADADEKPAAAAPLPSTSTSSLTLPSSPPLSTSSPRHLVAVHLGVYASATSPVIRLESRAYNTANFRVPDADGKVLLRERITKDRKKNLFGRKKTAGEAEEEHLETALPLRVVAARLDAASASGSCRWKATTTDDAGRYICNYIYWHSLCACSRRAEREEEEAGASWSSKLSSLRRLLLAHRRRSGSNRASTQEGEEGGKRPLHPPRLKRHALFVHLPPAEVLSVEEQLEFVWRLLGVLSEVLEEEGGEKKN